MYILGATDEADARHAVAAAVHHFLGCMYQTRVVAKSEVVVGTEVEHFLAIDVDGGLLGALNETLVFVEAGFAYLSEGLAEMFFHFTVHCIILF